MLYFFCSKAVASAAVSESNISTISNNANGGCTQVSVSPNNTTVGISPCGAVPKSIEVEVDVKKRSQKKRTRFQNQDDTVNPAEKEAFLDKTTEGKLSPSTEPTVHNSR